MVSGKSLIFLYHMMEIVSMLSRNIVLLSFVLLVKTEISSGEPPVVNYG